ncbi:MAG: tRNA pseudouridine(13) synthase TruD [Planctomycetota bacterium]
MKIKQLPSDFVVREVSELKPGRIGIYAVYELAKFDIGTIEAMDIISKFWAVSRKAISAGGLKDRHAQTAQLISIYRGPDKDMTQDRFRLKYLGRAEHAIRPASFDANHFTITIRDLSKAEMDRITQRLDEVKRYGLPNYFDEQRFGSVRAGNDFAAKQLIRRDYEGALKTALTSTSGEDRKQVREIRIAIIQNWGKWAELMQLLPRSSERSIINYLRDHQPTNFRRGFELIDPKLVLLYLHAYQSYLWNKGLVRYLSDNSAFSTGGGPASGWRIPHSEFMKIPYMLGEFVFYRQLTVEALESLKGLSIPFMTHRTVYNDSAIRQIFEGILKEENIRVEDFKIRGMVKTYFRKGERNAIIFPDKLAVTAAENDELNKGKQKMTVSFEIPRGAYATILVKRLTYD